MASFYLGKFAREKHGPPVDGLLETFELGCRMQSEMREELTFRHAGRDFRLTDTRERVVNEIVAWRGEPTGSGHGHGGVGEKPNRGNVLSF